MEKLLIMEPPIHTMAATNSTSWVGHLQMGGQDLYKFAGQTFRSPLDGWLQRIEIYSSGIQNPGILELTLHPFDPHLHQWQPELAMASLFITRQRTDPWIVMDLNRVRLEREHYYGFRLQSRDALLAIGERARTARQPGIEGQEWTANTHDREGNFFHYFNLVFRLGIHS